MRTGAIVRHEEWSIIRDMDRAFLDATAPAQEGQPVRSSSSELAPAAFDAVFG